MNYPTNFRYVPDGNNENETTQNPMSSSCPCKARREQIDQSQQQQQSDYNNESYRDPPPITCPCRTRSVPQEQVDVPNNNNNAYENYRELPSSALRCPCKSKGQNYSQGKGCSCKSKREGAEGQQYQAAEICVCQRKIQVVEPKPSESYGCPQVISDACDSPQQQQQQQLPEQEPPPQQFEEASYGGPTCVCKMKRQAAESSQYQSESYCTQHQQPPQQFLQQQPEQASYGGPTCVCKMKRQVAESSQYQSETYSPQQQQQPSQQAEEASYGGPQCVCKLKRQYQSDSCNPQQQQPESTPIKTCPCKARKLAAEGGQQHSDRESPQPAQKICPCKGKREAAREIQAQPPEPECFRESPIPPCPCKAKRAEPPADRSMEARRELSAHSCSCKKPRLDYNQQQQVMSSLQRLSSQLCQQPNQLTTTALAAATAANVARNMCGPPPGPFQVQGIATIQPIISGASSNSSYSTSPCRKRIAPEQAPSSTCGGRQIATITTTNTNISDDEYFSLSSVSSEQDDAYHMSHKITYTCTSQTTQKSAVAPATSQGTANTTTMESTSISQARNATILHLLHEVVHLINKDDIQSVDIAPTRMRNIGHYGKEDSACDSGPFISPLKATFSAEHKNSSMHSDPSCGMSGTLMNQPTNQMTVPVQYDFQQPLTIPLQYPCQLIIAPASISIQPGGLNIPSAQAINATSAHSSQQTLPACPCKNRPPSGSRKKSPGCSNPTSDELSHGDPRSEKAKHFQLIEEIADLAMDATMLCKENAITMDSQMNSRCKEFSSNFRECICPVHGIAVPQPQGNTEILYTQETSESMGNVSEPIIDEEDCDECDPCQGDRTMMTDCGPIGVPPVDCSKLNCTQEMDFMRLDCPQTQLDGGTMGCMPTDCMDSSYMDQPTITMSQGCVNPDCANYKVTIGTSTTHSCNQQNDDNIQECNERSNASELQPIECTEGQCQCCHCRAMREQQQRNNCMTIATPHQVDVDRKQSCSELKFFIDSIIMDLDAMQNARRRKQMEQNLCPPKPQKTCTRQGFPVTITDVSDLGTTSLYVKWTIHDCFGIGGYEIYVDGYLTNRYFHFSHEAAVICDVDVTIPHKVVLLAQPKIIERFDDLYGCPGTGDKSKQLLRSNDCASDCNSTCANWVPSIYLYDPCSRMEKDKCPC